MACPKCGCKVHYQYDPDPELIGINDQELEKCSWCNYIFDLEEMADDDETNPYLLTGEELQRTEERRKAGC